jgi:hypothetical protein
VVWGAIHAGLEPTVAGVVLTALIVALAGLSIWSATRRRA